jgi:hypothetical protein
LGKSAWQTGHFIAPSPHLKLWDEERNEAWGEGRAKFSANREVGKSTGREKQNDWQMALTTDLMWVATNLG